jgi:2-succinyl-6-hydroxy-2,4-cyclohexadiene-1-carboxylate synthase
MMRIYALSGFLGLPSDWNGMSFEKQLEHREIIPKPSLREWAEHFNQNIKNDGAEKRVLIGYSMGGRLAMHALIDEPSLWHAAVIVSSHPGLIDHKERLARQIQDIKWAERFEKEPWQNVMREWNAQEVFAGSSGFERFEHDYSRHSLSKILQHFSLGRQENLRSKLHHLSVPVLYVSGQKDLRYCALANECAQNNSNAKLWIAPEAGHRVPWQQSIAFQQQVTNFMKEV